MDNKILGSNPKTSLAGYAGAALTALEPIATDTADFSTGTGIAKFGFRCCVAVGIACIGRYAADSKKKSNEATP